MEPTEDQLTDFQDKFQDLLVEVFGITPDEAYDVASEAHPVIEQLVSDLN